MGWVVRSAIGGKTNRPRRFQSGSCTSSPNSRSLLVQLKATPMAPKSKRAKSGRRRLGTGKEQLVAVRLSTERIKQIDAWAKGAGAASRAEAIRRLVNQSLVAPAQQPRRGSHKGASKATELASEEIDRRVDHS